MLKKIYSICEIQLQIKPIDPLLIKSGYEAEDGTKMAFIKTNRRGEPEVFLPGSSLKGVLRSYFEKICRTIATKQPAVCLPYKEYNDDEEEIFCGAMFQHRRELEKNNEKPKDILNNNSQNIYRYSCPACRMFGSTYFIGRCSISDAYSKNSISQLEVRPGVAIDRHSGKVAQGPFDYQALPSGDFSFFTTITIRNFELWMLGAWAYLLRDLKDRMVRIGAHKSRGMGNIEATVTDFKLAYYKDTQGKILGLQEMVTSEEGNVYGLYKSNLPSLASCVNPTQAGVRYIYDLTQNYSTVIPQLAPVFNGYMAGLDWWVPLTQYAR